MSVAVARVSSPVRNALCQRARRPPHLCARNSQIETKRDTDPGNALALKRVLWLGRFGFHFFLLLLQVQPAFFDAREFLDHGHVFVFQAFQFLSVRHGGQEYFD